MAFSHSNIAHSLQNNKMSEEIESLMKKNSEDIDSLKEKQKEIETLISECETETDAIQIKKELLKSKLSLAKAIQETITPASSAKDLSVICEYLVSLLHEIESLQMKISESFTSVKEKNERLKILQLSYNEGMNMLNTDRELLDTKLAQLEKYRAATIKNLTSMQEARYSAIKNLTITKEKLLAESKSEKNDKEKTKEAIEILNNFLKRTKTTNKSATFETTTDGTSLLNVQAAQMAIENAFGYAFQMNLSGFLQGTELAAEIYQSEPPYDKEYGVKKDGGLLNEIENFDKIVKERLEKTNDEEDSDDENNNEKKQSSVEREANLKSVIEDFEQEISYPYAISLFLTKCQSDIEESLKNPITIQYLSKENDFTTVRKSLDTLIEIVKKCEDTLLYLKTQFIKENKPKIESIPEKEPVEASPVFKK